MNTRKRKRRIRQSGPVLAGLLFLTLLSACGRSGISAWDIAPPTQESSVTSASIDASEGAPESTASSGSGAVSATTSEETPEAEAESLPETTPEPTSESTPEPMPEPMPEPTSEPTSEPTPEPTPEPARATIRMVGDMLLHDPVEAAAITEQGGYDFSFLFEKTKDRIGAADIAIVNQEVILGGIELGISGYPSFNGPAEVTDALAEAGFDVVLHATNHALDRGANGVLNTLTSWRERHPEVTVLGIHDSAEDRQTVRIREVNGIRIALVNYTYGTNGVPLPAGMPFAVDYLDEAQIARDLQIAEAEADFTIVCPHWGAEYYLGDTDQQHYWLDLFRKEGADLVLGAHPHVVGPIAWLEDEDPDTVSNNKGNGDLLVYYSLGNYANWTSQWGDGIANRMLGGMAEVTIEQKEDGEVAIAGYGITPLICHVRSGSRGITVYPYGEYSEELAAENEITIQDPNFSYEYLSNLCDSVWGDLWR